MNRISGLNYYLNFPCNTCCIITNQTIMTEYKELTEEYIIMMERIKKYETSLFVNCCFLMCLILGRFKFPKRLPKKNKINFDFENTAVYF